MEALENPLPKESPSRYVQRVTQVKLGVALEQLKQLDANAVALVADTTVTIDGMILGKPETAENNAAMLRRLSGRTHRVLTAVAVGSATKQHNVLCVARVSFAPLSEVQISRYTATGEGFDKAGGYAIQGLAAPFVKHISGDYSGIVGLPLFATATLLKQFQFDI